MGACETSPTTTRPGEQSPILRNTLITDHGFLAGDYLPPLVGVQLVRPRPRRKRLRLRALQLDTSHADGDKPASYEEASTTVTHPPATQR
jgi:hypothetical protein